MITLSKSFDEIKYVKQYVQTCYIRILPDFLVSCLNGRIKRVNKKNRSTQTIVGNCRIKNGNEQRSIFGFCSSNYSSVSR